MHLHMSSANAKVGTTNRTDDNGLYVGELDKADVRR